MRYIVKVNNQHLVVNNTMTNDGAKYLFNKCFRPGYNVFYNFYYNLIDAVGFVATDPTDTLTLKNWNFFDFSAEQNYRPKLALFETTAKIYSDPVELLIRRNGFITGLVMANFDIVLSVAVFSNVQQVRKNDLIEVSYEMSL